MKDLADYNPVDPGILECPYEFYGRLRDDAPVYLVPQTGHYVVSRYDLVIEAARNPKVFSSNIHQGSLDAGGLYAELLHSLLPDRKDWGKFHGHCRAW